MANITNYPPDAIGWHCNICDTPVDPWQQLDHIASPQHRARADRHPLGALADELSGQWILRTGAGQDRRIGGGVGFGGTGGGGERKWKQPMVEDGGEEYEDAEDYEETDSEEEEGGESDEDEDEDDEEDDYAEEEEVVDGRILWTCDICTITINIFARDDHLRSRPHLRAARPESYEPPTPSAQPALRPTWHCTLCDEEMTVFHQGDHLASKQHLKMARKQQTETAAPQATFYPAAELDSDAAPVPCPILPEVARSSAYQFRNTFYCITCAGEFDRSMLELHLDTTNTWECTLCAVTMHPAARDQHLDSEMHIKLLEAENEDLFCDICQRSYKLAGKASHLAGTAHRTIAAKQRFEQMLREQRNAVQPPVNTAAATGPGAAPNAGKPSTTASNQRTDPWSCHLCGEYLYAELLSSHLTWNCTVAPGSRACKVAPASNARRPTNSKTATPKPKKNKKKKKAPPEGSLYCSICKKYKMAIGMEDHMNSLKHKKKAAAKQKNKAPAVKAANPSPVPKAKPEKPVPAPAPAPQVQAATPLIAPAYTTITGDSFRCSVCARTRMTAGIADHVRSKKHKKNVLAARRPQPLAPGGTA